MSDYLGPNQTRVMDSTNHSFESIIYQVQKPPLSSEVNLTGKIDAERSQKVVQAIMPSGWAGTGQFRNDVAASTCQVGDVLCSSDCSANSFYFIAKDFGINSEKNVAFVNGWRVVVQGSSSPQGNSNDDDLIYLPYTNNTEDNLIRLPDPPEAESRIDFVFLEVWRKLLTPDDNIYQYGNVDHANPFANDLIDPARGFETSLRIQVQYRIRVAKIDDIDLHPEGMDSPSVHVQGPNPEPVTACDHSYFSRVPGDPGLWIAGSGDTVAQETLGTVDGHTYAIPMFAIRRRNTQPFDPRISQINGTDRSMANYKNGIASDRPDNMYNDWIVADDFVDLRHRVGLGGDLKSLCFQAFRTLQSNKLKTYMANTTLGGEQDGAVLLKADYITPTPTSIYPQWGGFLGSGNGSRTQFLNNDGSGFREVPTKFLETREITVYPTQMNPIAMRDQDIRVRYGSDASAVYTTNHGSQFNMLRARGGSYKDPYNFGHQMVYHKIGNGTGSYTVPASISGYNILGIADITLDGTSSASFSTIHKDTDYTVNLSASVTSGLDVQFTLYTGNKFFDANKQGRGITDCFQMVFLGTDQTPTGARVSFSLTPPGSSKILAVGSYGGYDGSGVAYVNGDLNRLVTSNRTFDGTNIRFQAAPTASIIPPSVPVLLHTAVSGSESFAFFYQYVPYQGLLDTTTPHTVTGAIEVQGPAITTSAGSGTIINYSMETYGFFTGTKSIYGAGEDWCVDPTDWSTARTVKPGYMFSMNTDSTVYMVTEVVSDNLLYLSSAPDRSSTGVENFTVTALDVPLYSYPNIIDRFPTYRASNDCSGNSVLLNKLGSTIEARIASRVQDVLDVPVNTVRIGEYPADRGQSSVNIPEAPYGRGNLGIIYEPVDVYSYKKTYQSYLLNRDNSGRLYLMVVGSETANTDTTDCKLNAYSEKDSVDIFEIPGRPLLTNRIQ